VKRFTNWASQHRLGLLLLFFMAVAAPFSPTITQIVAGNGLTGGGNGGSVTLSLSAPVSIANGGTNRTTALNNNRAMVSSGGAIAESNASTSSQVLVGGSPPAFGPVPIAAIPTGTSSSTVTIGNDSRIPPTPSGAGKLPYDTGSAYAALAAGTAGQVLTGAGASAPTWAAPITATTSTATLGSTFLITGSSGTYQDSGLTMSLPSAGTYLLSGRILGNINVATGGSAFLSCKFRDTTAGADVANSQTIIACVQPANTTVIVTAPMFSVLTVSGATSVNLYCARNLASTYNASEIDSTSAGYTQIGYMKISP